MYFGSNVTFQILHYHGKPLKLKSYHSQFLTPHYIHTYRRKKEQYQSKVSECVKGKNLFTKLFYHKIYCMYNPTVKCTHTYMGKYGVEKEKDEEKKSVSTFFFILAFFAPIFLFNCVL